MTKVEATEKIVKECNKHIDCMYCLFYDSLACCCWLIEITGASPSEWEDNNGND